MTTTALIKLKKSSTTKLNLEQRTFNKLKKKIEFLQIKEKNRLKDLDYCLQFYFLHLRKEETELMNSLIQRVKRTYEFIKTKNRFTKNELKILTEYVLDDINEIFLMHHLQDVPKEIFEIFDDLTKKEIKNLEKNEKNTKKSSNDDEFDFIKNIKPTDSEEEIAKKLFESFFKDEEFSEIRKQAQKEFLNQKTEVKIENKDINTIYKKLAKIFHPDLEQDTEKKIEKEKLMKQLTIAYETKDFYTLMSLEKQWIYKNQVNTNLISQDKLKIYNKMLRKQIKDLEQKIDVLHLNPNYLVIRHLFDFQFTGSNSMHFILNKIKKDIKELKNFIERLVGSEAMMFIKLVLKNDIRSKQSQKHFN